MTSQKKAVPFDVEALEKSLNDSATRVSTIWISFLVFSLYLLIAATTIEHRQLLLSEPIKLPVLNVDLPLWGFFFLAPILFVLFHFYVLLQVLLLARTALSYNTAIDQAIPSPTANAMMRQRLANTLFAQMFAGSPRERTGWLGRSLKAMAWITLVISPIIILIAFLIAFLPYHSHSATWVHRLLILIELAVAFLFWPLVLNAQRDFDWALLKHKLRQLTGLPRRITGFLLWPLLQKRPWPLVPKGARIFDWPIPQQRRELRRLGHVMFQLLALFCVVLTLLFATFPGEQYANLPNGREITGVSCERGFTKRFDRLDVTRANFVDGKELPRIEKDIVDRGLYTYQSERTRILRERNLDCAIFAFADLRYVDFSDTSLVGATFDNASIQGASFEGSRLGNATFNSAKLQGSYFKGSQLQEASLRSAALQGSIFENAKLQGAVLNAAKLQGANLRNAQLQGASMRGVQLQGADLFGSQLRGAVLTDAQLQGASLWAALLEGASLNQASLQGANLQDSLLTSAEMSGIYIWRSRNVKCMEGHVSNQVPDKGIVIRSPPFFRARSNLTTTEAIEDYIDNSVSEIRDATVRKATHERMHSGLLGKLNEDAATKAEQQWRDCEAATKAVATSFNDRRAKLLIKLICESKENSSSVARGTINNFLQRNPSWSDFFFLTDFKPSSAGDQEFGKIFAKALLSETVDGCETLRSLDQSTGQKIRRVADGDVGRGGHDPFPILFDTLRTP
ncbi:uncharacterized protein YjbI with pentapeptide repeats [Bradyrhizobium sp. AZCC 2262]|uniref:pentapeptide repeat-containing protein n=1 Tax=Bradyrhizobium sp. AZCC 2262 TaxID=3117022 RepID=UPI002FF33330